MKQRAKGNKTNNSSGGIIRNIFREELKNFEKTVDKKFVSFEEKMDIKFENLESKMDFKLENLESKMDFKLENLERRVDEKARQYHDEVLTKMDGVMGELQNMREENIIKPHQIERLNDQVEDHEKRIRILESTQKS